LLYDWFFKMGQSPTIIDASELLASPIEVRLSRLHPASGEACNVLKDGETYSAGHEVFLRLV
jgi:hypothetical protein